MAKEQLRKATEADRKLLFDWANDAVVRANSFQTAPIAWETHVAWFEKLIEDEKSLQFIYECDGVPAGQVRLKLEDEAGVISYSVAAEWRGQGVAKRMLAALEELVKKEYPQIHAFDAEVKSENVASKKIFKNLDYQESVLIYRKVLQ